MPSHEPDAGRSATTAPRRLRHAALGAGVLAIGVALASVWSMYDARSRGPGIPAPAAASASPAPEHPFGFVDEPAAATIVASRVRFTGWSLALRGVERIEARVGGVSVAVQYGLARPDVGSLYPRLPDAARGGFAFEVDLRGRRPGRHPVVVTAVDRAGKSHVLARKSLIDPALLARWNALRQPGDEAGAPFYLMPATSGIQVHGADEIRETYAPYESSTMRVGVRVPILYLRTTKGRAGDWVFDPDWDFDRRCGDRRIADDSLSALIAYAEARRLPVLFTLNGGIWADASCDVPDWDINDELERDPRNTQWTARGTVPRDDALRDLAGSQASPEIARALTLNVYANAVRTYKRRNLQAAASIVRDFARRHPDLFVGISLDPDVYVVPWYQGREWFDFNPDTIKQFREWLRGTGPYAGGDPKAGIPDLRRFRREPTLSLGDVRRLANRRFRTWDDVEPPRAFPPHGDLGQQKAWNEAWLRTWDQFRRHLVHVHYNELAEWVADTGIATDRIYTAQAFTAPDPGYLPQAIGVMDAATDYDSGGVSVEGAIPERGRLGVILYGDSTANTAATQSGEPQFRIFERMADRWAVVEFSTANLKKLDYLPTYADAYRALRELTNANAALVSPMAWNGSNGVFVGQPGYVPYTSWRNTPAEEAAFDLLAERANLPATAKLWTFGSTLHADTDGWRAEGGTIAADHGHLTLESSREM